MRRVLSYILVAVVLATGLEAAPRTNTPKELENAIQKNASKPRSKSQRAYQVGTASWYGRQFDGKPTASGETFKMYQFTAAHRHLPLGTIVRVTNLHNGESVVVRVNDRGPVPASRIIDLSYGAARQIGMSGAGLQPVRVDIVQPAPEIARNEGFLP